MFSLGRILYDMLTGRSPAPYQHLDLLPAEFRDVVAVATAELPGDRYSSVAEFSGVFIEAQRADPNEVTNLLATATWAELASTTGGRAR